MGYQRGCFIFRGVAARIINSVLSIKNATTTLALMIVIIIENTKKRATFKDKDLFNKNMAYFISNVAPMVQKVSRYRAGI